MNDSLNKQLTRVVDDLGSVNHDKIKSLLSAINTRNLSGVDCIPWQFNALAFWEPGETPNLTWQCNDPDAVEVFNSDEFNISLSGCIKISESVQIPAGFATSLSWSVQLNFPAPLISPSPVVFTTLVGITDQTSLDAWYVAFLAACELAGIDTSIWFGEPGSFGPSFIPLSPDEMTFFLFSPNFSFDITAVVEDESVTIEDNEVAECRYNVIAPALYPGRLENLYIGRLSISIPSVGFNSSASPTAVSVRDYVLYNKGLQFSNDSTFVLNPEVFRFYSDIELGDPSNYSTSVCFVLENIVFSRVAFLYDFIRTLEISPLFVNFHGYKIGSL